MNKKSVFLISVVLSALFFNSFVYANTSQPITTIELRKINPPKLAKKHLGKKILCHRPMRQGSPKMMVEVKNNKIVAHNYGHGGSGWTLGPGAAKHVVGLLEQEMKAKGMTKEEPIAIVGAGALGLFSALELIEDGYKNITIISDSFDNLTSHNAGGLLAPVSMDNDPEMQKLINKIGIDAYIYYKNIAEGKNKVVSDGAIIVPTYFENRKDSGLEPYVGEVMMPAKDVVLDFQNGTLRRMVAYDDGIFMDTGSLMTSLTNALADKVTYKQQKVKNLADLSEKVVINCTGNGAKILANDNKMVSVQGHLVMLNDQNPDDLQHMILVYFGKGKTKAGFDIKRSFYMFPKRLPGSQTQDVGVIGGTFIEGADAQSPHYEEFEIMLKGAKEFYGLNEIRSIS